jgi:TonB-dependent SusC/RagA subfamily outer membrane receptor
VNVRRAVLVCGLAVASQAGVACHQRSSDVEEAAPPPDLGPRALHFPGVDVIRMPGGGVLIRMVGGQILGQEPLFVIDGTPTTVDPRRGIDWLTPEQIANIEVIKDPARTAIYGPRGAHGVIVVTTKRNR